MTDSPTPAALSEPMSDDDWSRFKGVVQALDAHPDFWHHAVVMKRGLAELDSLRAEVTRLRAAAEAETARLDWLDQHGATISIDDGQLPKAEYLIVGELRAWIDRCRAPHSPAAGASS